MEVQIDQPRPTSTPAAPAGGGVPSIWSDPNLLAIMLGTMGQAVMGRHQQTWQAQMGKGAVGLGQSFKMAGVAGRREAERKKERDYWRKLFESVSGLGKPGEEETMSLGDMAVAGAPY